MITRTTLLVAMLPLAVAQATCPAQAHPPSAATTCHGVAATIVGPNQGAWIQGTDGPDVIVSNGAHDINSGAGDDLICMSDSDPDFHQYISVTAGDGDDVIDASADDHKASFVLGAGDDVFTGGPAGDLVNARDDGEFGNSGREGRDDIATGAGDDYVDSGSYTVVDHDVIDLGDGDDRVAVRPTVGPDTRVSGGAGVDAMTIGDLDNHHWVLDNRAGNGRRDLEPWLAWTGLEEFRLDGLVPHASSVRFIGGAADEHVEVYRPTVAGLTLGPGDDSVLIVSPDLAPLSFIRGGRGRDIVTASPYRTHASVQSVEVDLGRGRLRYAFASGDGQAIPLAGFEDIKASAPHVRVAGNGGPNVIGVSSCDVEVAGGAGDDLIRWYRDRRHCRGANRPGPHVALYGNRGNDHLAGSPYDDILVGGRGIDRANGRSGKDRCGAEERMGCEVSGP